MIKLSDILGILVASEQMRQRESEMLRHLKSMVPRAGIEPALPSEPHFECGASTSSANGASKEACYHGPIPPASPAMDPMDYKVESAVASGERPSCNSMCSHSKLKEVYQINARAVFPEDCRKPEDLDTAIRLTTIHKELSLPGTLDFAFMYDSRGYFYAQVFEVDAVDNVTGLPMDAWFGRKWLLSEHMTDAEIVQTVFKAVMTAVEHEVRETFLYKGHSVFDPHYDLEKLLELRKEKDALVHRA